jgi:hypothetical protein
VKFLGRFLGILMVLLVVVTLPCATWVFSAEALLLDINTYKTALARENVYTDLIPALLPAIAESSAENGIQDPEALTVLNIVGNLEESDWQIIAQELIPADWLQTAIESNLDAFFRWLHDETTTPHIAFDTQSLRERLSGASGQRAVNQILQSWSPCNEDELNTLLSFDDTAGAEYPFCQPPGEYMAFASETLSSALSEQAQNLPDTWPRPEWSSSERARTQLSEFKLSIRILQAIVIEFLLFPIALLSLMVFFTVRSLKSFGRWTGTTMLLSGIATILPIPLLLSPFMLPNTIAAVASTQNGAGAEPSPYARVILQGIMRSIVGEFTLPVLVLAAFMVGLGFLGLFISIIVRYPEESHANTDPGITPASGTYGARTLTPSGQATPAGEMMHTRRRSSDQPYGTAANQAELADSHPQSPASPDPNADPFPQE